ncbi:Os08g0532500, partial [Oryza sativa Japonica Group]
IPHHPISFSFSFLPPQASPPALAPAAAAAAARDGVDVLVVRRGRGGGGPGHRCARLHLLRPHPRLRLVGVRPPVDLHRQRRVRPPRLLLRLPPVAVAVPGPEALERRRHHRLHRRPPRPLPHRRRRGARHGQVRHGRQPRHPGLRLPPGPRLRLRLPRREVPPPPALPGRGRRDRLLLGGLARRPRLPHRLPPLAPPVDDDESKYLQVAPQLASDDLDSNNSGQEGKELENFKISEECLSSAYQNVLKRLAQLQRLGQVGKGANRKRQRIGGLELEPCIDSLDDGWTKDMVLEDVVNIDVGFDVPPPSFAAGMKLQKKRRARIEAAKCRIDAIRKGPVESENKLQAALRNEDACSPQKPARKKRGKKRIAGSDRAMNGELPIEMPDGPGGEKKRRKGAPSDGIDWEDCIIELLLLHGANEEEIEQGQYRRLLDLHVFCAVSASGHK